LTDNEPDWLEEDWLLPLLEPLLEEPELLDESDESEVAHHRMTTQGTAMQNSRR